MTSSARRSASTSRLATSAMKRSAARDGIRSVRRDLRRAAGRPRAPRRSRSRRAAGGRSGRAGRGGARPGRAARRATRIAACSSPATSASASVQALRSAEEALDSSTSSAPRLAPAPCSSASFSSSRSRRCWRSPTWATSALAACRRARGRARAARACDPARQLPRLDAALLGDLAAGLLDRLAQPVGDLVAALLAGEEARPSGLAVHALQRGGDLLDVGVLPALDAVGDHEAAAHRERHRRSARPRRRPACTRRPRAPRRRRRRSRPRPARAAWRGARRCGRGRRRGSGRRA